MYLLDFVLVWMEVSVSDIRMTFIYKNNEILQLHVLFNMYIIC